MTGHGVVDGPSVDLTMDFGKFAGAFGGGGAGKASSTLREIMLRQHGDEILYFGFGRPIFHGKQWASEDTTKVYAALGGKPGSLPQETMDPSQLLQMLKGEGDLENLGTATIDGVTTTHYRVVVDVAKLLQRRGSSPAMKQLAASAGMKSIPEDAWVGQDGLVRRLQMTLSMSANGTPLQMTMVVDYTAFGVGAAIAAPPSSQVFDMTSLVTKRVGSTTGLLP
jgi:hypothetical protein